MSRIAPSPSQCASAAASCSLSRSGNWIFSTTADPSSEVAGSTSDVYASENGTPTFSDHRSTHSSTMRGSRPNHAAPSGDLPSQLRPSGTTNRIAHRSHHPKTACRRRVSLVVTRGHRIDGGDNLSRRLARHAEQVVDRNPVEDVQLTRRGVRRKTPFP